MSPYEYLSLGGLVVVVLVAFYIALKKPDIGSTFIAATLSGAYLGFTIVTIWSEGVVQVWTNHTTNLWGVQVWWDLLFALAIALFLIAPRARKQGMNVPLWTLIIVSTGSIGLLAMCAVLFRRERDSAPQAT